MLCFRLSITKAQMLKESGIVRERQMFVAQYILCLIVRQLKKDLILPLKIRFSIRGG